MGEGGTQRACEVTEFGSVEWEVVNSKLRESARRRISKGVHDEGREV